MSEEMGLSAENYEELMREFPCTFNLQYSANIPINKFKVIRKKLLDELNSDEDDEEEVIRKKSLLSWVHFNLGETDEATELNNEVVEFTKKSNVVSLANRVFIMWRNGDELEANSSFEALMQLKTKDDFESLLTVAKAEQAYCYTRLGGSSCLRMAAELFTEAVEKQPHKYLWKYGLGLVYRRAVNANIHLFTQDEWIPLKCTQKAVDLLFDVGENADDKLRGMAYSQLATLKQNYPPKYYPEYTSVFRDINIHQLCNKALHFDGKNPVVLRECGRSIKGIDLYKGIEYLTKSAALRENSVTYHHLGNAYKRKANLIAAEEIKGRRTQSNSDVPRQLFGQDIGSDYQHGGKSRSGGRGGDQRSVSDGGKRWETGSAKSFAQSPSKSVPLNSGDENVKEAVKYLKLALKVSHNENLPAALDLGILYKQCGQIDEALKFFNQVTNYCGSNQRKNIMTVISAYECAGECYFQLNKDKNDAKLQEAGEEKLTTAINLALDLESSKPNFEDCARDIWTALRTLETQLDKFNSPIKERKQIKLFDLIKDHGRKIKTILKLMKLRDAETDDPELTFKLIDSHLQLKQYEDALAFLKMMQVKPREVDLWKSDGMSELKIKVLLSAISSRLEASTGSSKSLFQQTFECVYGSCARSDAEYDDDKEESGEPEVLRDVLLLYDDSNDTEAGPSDATRKVRLLQSVLAGPLGLDAEKNLRYTIMSVEISLSEENYKDLMEEFPCVFNLKISQKTHNTRLKAMKQRFTDEMKREHVEEEIIRKKNLLSWILFQLDETDEAIELNKEVLELTNRANVVSLGNKVFIMWQNGDELEAKDSYSALQNLKTRSDFESLLTVAKAEQAYCYGRIGSSINLRMAIKLFTEVVDKEPQKYSWKFGLGLAYRRATNVDIFCNKCDGWNPFDCTRHAADLLFDVAENDDSALSAMAYAQLIILRKQYPPLRYPQYESIFRGYDIHKLCDKALESNNNNPTVLTQCGKYFEAVDVDRAIDLLERSVKIKNTNSAAYHYLGNAYERKAGLIASGRYTDRSKNCSNVSRQLFTESINSAQEHGGKDVTAQAEKRDPSITPDELLDSGFYSISETQREQATLNHMQTDSDTPAKITSKSVSQDAPQDTPRCEQQRTRPRRDTQSLTLTGIADVGHLNLRGSEVHYQRYLSESGEQYMKKTVKAYVKSTTNDNPLDIKCELVKKAIENFNMAIKVSHNGNLPAVYSLGILNKRCGQLKEALKNFNKAANSPDSRNHAITVINAYEQAGCCYYELSKDSSDKQFQEDGEKKLTMAVSLALDLESSKPGFKDCARDIWTALRTLEAELDKAISPMKERKQIKLFDLIKDHSRKIKAILELMKLSDAETDDPELIFKLIDSHLQLKQYEDALAFLKMTQVKPREVDPWKSDRMADLKIKVLLSAISSRLEDSSGNSKSLFQQTFECVYGSCARSDAEYNDDKDESGEPEMPRDVLLLYDNSNDTEAGPSDATKKVRLLQSVLADLLGVDAEENLRVP